VSEMTDAGIATATFLANLCFAPRRKPLRICVQLKS
jgi:hypothetical protein